jgi:leader peptidase (prepilin peptidase)/N-methyltransferase
MIIFDRFHIILLALGALSMPFDKAFGTLSHILGGVVGFLLFYLIAALFERLCGKEGLGGGDIKLAGAAGLLLGWERLLLGLLIATIPAATIMLIAQRKNGEGDKRFAFAPFLTTGFIVSMLFGERIIELYLSLLGF